MYQFKCDEVQNSDQSETVAECGSQNPKKEVKINSIQF